MIARTSLLLFIASVVIVVFLMASNDADYRGECNAKGGQLIRIYPNQAKCVDLSKITLD